MDGRCFVFGVLVVRDFCEFGLLVRIQSKWEKDIVEKIKGIAEAKKIQGWPGVTGSGGAGVWSFYCCVSG
ncbi:hypothetical protein KDK_56720 [Dictyobacter kobayashii]|uniref:Uncharacterized protein n=1 Tax=Dictyobacter kobayashii TaxID=2014872 RepID=A0A402AS04_9CHLR|nr:hypothetical protein KDK_56720 [Dictyobacter kobayashii]